jgi:uncharacterized damage-inducible protein DinB
METSLKYPVGDFERPEKLSEGQRSACIRTIAETPARLKAAVAGLSEAQLETPYRPGGWTVRQVVHHMADSHMNSYVRFRLALTEDEPTIKTYDEARWAELSDAKTAPIEPSLTLLDTMHERWVMLLRGLTPKDWTRTFRHPERGLMTLEQNLALYDWHGRHHVAHVTELRKREGW